MNKHTANTMTTAALRDLDPAPEPVLTEAERERADATFARIVATPSDETVPVEPGRQRRRRWRLLVPVGLAAAAAIAIPSLMLGGGGSAFASWTPTPEPLPAETASEAVATCRDEFGVSDRGGQILLAERRGDWTYAVIEGPKEHAFCLMRNDDVGRVPADGPVLGSYGAHAAEVPTLPSDGFVEHSSGGSAYKEGDGLFSWLQEEEWVWMVRGYVGEDVTGVTVHPPVGPDVEASVDNGRFVAWWPSDPPSSENLEVMEAWSYTVTLADGSTRHTSG